MSMDRPNSGQDPNSPYGPPVNPYGAPQNPYGTPENPYANPYAASEYGQAPGYEAAATPVPLGQAIGQWPSQFVKVLTKPTAKTFVEEMGKASWSSVWVLLIIYAVINTVLVYVKVLIAPGTNTATTSGTLVISAATVRAIAYGIAWSYILVIPLGFFILSWITYGLARAFEGQGRLLPQTYSSLLFLVPLGILSAIFGFIPFFVGTFISIALGIYSLVLQIYAVMGVHRLSGGKASAVVLISAVLVAIAIFVMFFILGIVIFAIAYSILH